MHVAAICVILCAMETLNVAPNTEQVIRENRWTLHAEWCQNAWHVTIRDIDKRYMGGTFGDHLTPTIDHAVRIASARQHIHHA